MSKESPTPSELAKRLREKDEAITGTALARLQNPAFAALVVGLKAASQNARAYLEALIRRYLVEATGKTHCEATPYQRQWWPAIKDESNFPMTDYADTPRRRRAALAMLRFLESLR